jgi:hypothetical protein
MEWARQTQPLTTTTELFFFAEPVDRNWTKKYQSYTLYYVSIYWCTPWVLSNLWWPKCSPQLIINAKRTDFNIASWFYCGTALQSLFLNIRQHMGNISPFEIFDQYNFCWDDPASMLYTIRHDIFSQHRDANNPHYVPSNHIVSPLTDLNNGM